MSFEVALDPTNNPAKNKLELEKSLSSYVSSGGEIRLPRSAVPFPLEAGVEWPALRNLTLVGEGAANAYGTAEAGTTLLFSPSSGAAFDFTTHLQYGTEDAERPYAHIENIAINGNHGCAQGFKMGGVMSLNHCHAVGFTQAGIHAAYVINGAVIENCSALDNHIGLWIGGEGETENPSNHKLTVRALVARSNNIGVRWEQARNSVMCDSTIEANQVGMEFYRPAANRDLSHIILRDNHFEANPGYAIDINGNGVLPELVKIYDTHISAGAQNKAIRVTRLDEGFFLSLSGYGAVELESNCTGLALVGLAAGFTVNDAGSGNTQRSLSGLGAGSGSSTLPLMTEVSLPDSNHSFTANEIVNAAVEITPTGNVTLTLPPASAIITEMGGYEYGKTAEIVVMNRSGNGSTVTLAGNTGTIVKGKNVQPGSSSGTWGVMLTSATTVTVFNRA